MALVQWGVSVVEQPGGMYTCREGGGREGGIDSEVCTHVGREEGGIDSEVYIRQLIQVQ